MKSSRKLYDLLELAEDEWSHSTLDLPPLMNHAARYGNVAAVNAINSYMMYEDDLRLYAKPLKLAVKHNHPSCVDELVSWVLDREVMSAAMLAAGLGRLQALEIIITDLDGRGLLNDDSLRGPLRLALKYYQQETFKLLIDRFENVDGFVKMFLSSGHFDQNALKALIEYAYTRTITRPDHL